MNYNRTGILNMRFVRVEKIDDHSFTVLDTSESPCGSMGMRCMERSID